MNVKHDPDGSAEGVVEALYLAEYGRMVNVARRDGLRLREAENAVQETFVAALERVQAHKGEGPACWRAWLRGILHHKIADALRRKQAHACANLENLEDSAYEPTTPGADLAGREEGEYQLSLLRQILERHADDPHFRILTEHYLHRKSLANIATEQGLTADQVRDRQRRAMNKLREELNPDPPQAGKRSAKRRRKKS